MPSVGLTAAAGLIVAIGAQNAHVLRVSIVRSFVWPTVATCIAVDAALIAAGESGASVLLGVIPSLRTWLSAAGATYILWYGIRPYPGR